jgi:hypothetical protein
MKKLILAFGLVIVPGVAGAQTIDSYRLNYYNPGAAAPLQQSDAFPASGVACNVEKPTVINTINPTTAVWDDPANAGKVCMFIIPTTGTLPSLPLGSYEATLVAINSAGASAESNRAPFSRLALPAARTGFLLRR